MFLFTADSGSRRRGRRVLIARAEPGLELLASVLGAAFAELRERSERLLQSWTQERAVAVVEIAQQFAQRQTPSLRRIDPSLTAAHRG